MFTIFHQKKFMKGYREFDRDVDTSINLGKYVKLATVHCDTLSEAYHLTNNCEGAWSLGSKFEHPYSNAITWTQWELYDQGRHGKVRNEDHDKRIVMNPDVEYRICDDLVVGFRSTSSGDVIYDHAEDQYFFLVPDYLEERRGTVVLDNFDPKEFIYQLKKVA